jgi:cytidylate kinase
MRARQREFGPDVVLEGRDTGTRVRPDADVKVYLTASHNERAARRAGDLGLPVDAVSRSIEARDRRDAAQSAPAADAHVIDTSGASVDEVVRRVLALVEERVG